MCYNLLISLFAFRDFLAYLYCKLAKLQKYLVLSYLARKGTKCKILSAEKCKSCLNRNRNIYGRSENAIRSKLLGDLV
jgi:hypothetical protein